MRGEESFSGKGFRGVHHTAGERPGYLRPSALSNRQKRHHTDEKQFLHGISVIQRFTIRISFAIRAEQTSARTFALAPSELRHPVGMRAEHNLKTGGFIRTL